MVFVFLGEEGFAYVPLYKLFEEIVYFVIGFPIAKRFSVAPGRPEGRERRGAAENRPERCLRRGRVRLDPVGGALNLAGVERPEVVRVLSTAMVPLGTFLLLVSIGMSMKFSSVTGYRRECVALMGVKFLALPATAG